MDIFLARQPIFDRNQRVAAYYLRYRNGRLPGIHSGHDEAAAVRAVGHLLMGLGLDSLVGDLPAVIEVPREFVLAGDYELLPPGRTILLVRAADGVGDDLGSSLGTARRAGYRVALTDLSASGNVDLALIDQVMIDFQSADQDVTTSLLAARSGTTTFVARGLSSHADVHRAADSGFEQFHGSYFCEPEVVSGRDVGPNPASLISLISEVNRPELDIDAIEEVIRRDVGLSLKLLRYLQSAGLGWRHDVTTIGQAIRILGHRPIRKWASLVALTMVNDNKPKELVTTALIRAQFTEELGAGALGEELRGELFLVGLLSTLDALLDRPMAVLLQQMALGSELAATLLGEATRLRPYLATAIAYEQGDWGEVDALVAELGLESNFLPEAYHRTLAWVGELLAA